MFRFHRKLSSTRSSTRKRLHVLPKGGMHQFTLRRHISNSSLNLAVKKYDWSGKCKDGSSDLEEIRRQAMAELHWLRSLCHHHTLTVVKTMKEFCTHLLTFGWTGLQNEAWHCKIKWLVYVYFIHKKF